MSDIFNWGVLAPGNIAGRFADCMRVIPEARIAAVASRSIERAQKFASKWQIERVYGAYQELVDDSGVDAVYIAAPHRFHAELIRMALLAGKPVLCEKPVTVNAEEFDALTALADKKNLFLMEAMWMRHLPVLQKFKNEWLPQGRLGKIKRIMADFSFAVPHDPKGRLMNADLAGGALLDAGIYPLSFAYWLVGRKPDRITSLENMGETGVDMNSGILMSWKTGEMAVITTGIDVKGSMSARVLGTEGMVELPRPFFGAESMTFRNEKGEESIDISYDANGFEYEVREAMRCIRSGLKETPVHTWAETRDVMEMMDTLRASWNFRYDFE